MNHTETFKYHMEFDVTKRYDWDIQFYCGEVTYRVEYRHGLLKKEIDAIIEEVKSKYAIDISVRVFYMCETTEILFKHWESILLKKLCCYRSIIVELVDKEYYIKMEEL